MTELIKVTENNGKKLVSARELYNFLEVETPFHKWILRMFGYGFNENQDWTKMSTENQSFSVEYALTLDCAKEISMIQRSEKGKQARQYFIECEKQLKQQFEIPKTLSQALMLAAKQAEQIELQQAEIKVLEPKAEFFDTVTESKDTIDMGNAAKVLNMGLGRNKLFEFLRDKKVLMHNNKPYQTFIDRGYFRLIETTFDKPDGSTHINIKTLVYQKGLNYIKNLIETNK